MNHDFTIVRLVDASPDEVFDAMTDPAVQLEWWSPRPGTTITCDLRVGGTATVEWTADEGHRCRAEQTFVEIDRARRLVLTETVHEPDAPVYECTLTFTFTERDGKTELMLHHTGFPSADERDKHERGTNIFFGRLARHVGRVPSPGANIG